LYSYPPILTKLRSIAQKKNKTSGFTVDDDLFASDSSDLFGSVGKKSIPIPTKAKPLPVAETVSARKSLNPEDRLTKFIELRAFVSDRIGLKPAAKTPEQVRKTAWQHLFGLATSREQLESVTELFSKWRESRRVFDDRTVEKFVREYWLLIPSQSLTFLL
jgi:hypothetical protein